MRNQKRTIKNAKALAEKIGCNPGQVSRYLKDDRWTFGPGPWKESEIPAMKRWRAETLASKISTIPDDGSPGDIGTLRKSKLVEEIRRLKASADREEIELAALRRTLLPANEVTAWIGEHIGRAKGKLIGMAAAIAPRLEGLNTGERQSEIERYVDLVINEIREATGSLK